MNIGAIFRRLVFTQVLLGIIAFCMAAQSPGLLLLAGALAALSWYIVESPTGKPLSQWIIVPGALASLVWLLYTLLYKREQVIVSMGHFTMWLQVLLLYGRKSNREWGEILVLSLMQMIAASVLSVSFVYGLFLTVYSLVTLFTVLAFHLKVTGDQVAQVQRAGAPTGMRETVAPALTPVAGQGNRWHLRVTTLALGAGASVIAAMVFVAVPRLASSQVQSNGANGLGQREAGFSTTVDLSGGAPQQDNPAIVAHVVLKHNGVKLTDNKRLIRLRGAANDHYDRNRQQWTRTTATSTRVPPVQVVLSPRGTPLARMEENEESIEADIKLMSRTPPRVVFTMHPVAWIATPENDRIAAAFSPVDQQIVVTDQAATINHYIVRGPLSPASGYFQRYSQRNAQSGGVLEAAGRSLTREFTEQRPRSATRPSDPAYDPDYATGWRVDEARVSQFASEILGESKLARKRGDAAGENDANVATALAEYLRTHYKYSLTNAATKFGEDPVAEFLFNRKEGHCELFASGLAALARSTGLSARVVTGFLISEYNSIGGYYVVRNNDAHAWTEIYCGPELGWQTFDATPPDEVNREHSAGQSIFAIIWQAYEHIEYAWLSNVVSYDKQTRERVFGEVSQKTSDWIERQAVRLQDAVAWFKRTLMSGETDAITLVVMIFILIALILGVITLIRVIIVNRRRIVTLQLTSLSRPQRRALAKRLKFYLIMLDMLERHGHLRPRWQSPFSFAQQLAESNPMRFDPVVALTEIFYEIRFGHRDLDEARKARIKAHLRALEQNLAGRA